jgi:carboxymethylenebutenolidase
MSAKGDEMRFAAVLFVCCVTLLSCGSGTKTIDRSPSELAPGVSGVLVSPHEAGPHAGVVLLHGAVGWRPEIVDLASVLADSGFVALVIDYYAEVNRTPIRSTEKLEAWPAYQAAVQRAVEYLQSLPAVAGRPVGLVGFSRGAFLAVSVASSTPGVGAVVDFYGGGGGGPASLEEDVQGLPPILILHGDADAIVPVSFAFALRDAVIAAGGQAELHVYAGAGHVFNLSYSPTYSKDAADDATRRTIDFLHRRLTPGETTP